jgi:hypothetical protein
MILAYIWIEYPDTMCIKGRWNNQNNNDYTTRMTKYKYELHIFNFLENAILIFTADPKGAQWHS